jgi:hypothetical protein
MSWCNRHFRWEVRLNLSKARGEETCQDTIAWCSPEVSSRELGWWYRSVIDRLLTQLVP